MTIPAKKRICIIGGSNSVRAEGWTGKFAELLPDGFALLNESVGAAPCIMGYCRLVAADSLVPGDVVLWEYALNDQNHIDKHAYDTNLLLRFCEHTIILCLQRGLRFIPLIFATRSASVLPEMTEYRRGLHRLFDHYGIDYFDVTEELPKSLDRRRVPPAIYEDENHYKLDSFVSRYIAKRVLKRLTSGVGRLSAAAPLYTDGVVQADVITRFDGGVPTSFSNSRLTVSCFAPGGDTGPVAVRLDKGPFRLVGVEMICAVDGGAFKIQVGTRQFGISASYLEKRFVKPLLKLFTLSDDLKAGITYGAGDQVTVSWADATVPLASDFGFASPLTERQLMGRQSSIVGLVVEQLTASPGLRTS